MPPRPCQVFNFLKSHSIYFFLIGCVAVTWGLISFDLKRTHDWIFHHAHVQLKSLTTVYAEEVSTSVDTINYALIDLRERWDDNPLEFGALVQLRQAHLDPSVAFNVSVIDAQGKVIFTSMDWRLGPIDVSDREYFLFHLRDRADKLHISAPTLLREGPRWAILFTRPLPPKNGQFNGVISISVSPEYFYRAYENFSLGESGTIALARENGNILARYPNPDLTWGQSIQAAPWLSALPGDSGFFRKRSEVDDVERLYAWRILEDGRVAVIIGQSIQTILAPYQKQRHSYLWWGSAATLIFLLAAYLAGLFRVQSAKNRESMQQMEKALQHSQKLESIGKLTGGVAHDFNNILQIISSNVQLLEMTGKSGEEITPHLKDISEAIERGSRLATQLLTFARKQPLNPSPIDIESLIRNIDVLIQRLVGPAIEVRLVITEEVWNIYADPALLENVVFNLAANARDAMEGSGMLSIGLRNETIDGTHVSRYPGIVAGEYVELAIVDTGTGMPQAVVERVFEPFFTTKPEGKGTGLGLPMAYGFVKESGGHIHIDSAPGSGTTVRIFMPRSLNKVDAISSTPASQLRGGTESILVVEDNTQLRNMAVMMLEQLGYQVMEASNSPEAMKILESVSTIDVLLTDVVMPGGVDGVELAKNVRTTHPDMIILLASGDYELQESIQSICMEVHDVHFLQKPYSIHDVDAIIRRPRQEGAVVEETIS